MSKIYSKALAKSKSIADLLGHLRGADGLRWETQARLLRYGRSCGPYLEGIWRGTSSVTPRLVSGLIRYYNLPASRVIGLYLADQRREFRSDLDARVKEIKDYL